MKRLDVGKCWKTLHNKLETFRGTVEAGGNGESIYAMPFPAPWTTRRKWTIAATLASTVAIAGGIVAATASRPGSRVGRAASGLPSGDVHVRWSAPETLSACSGPGSPRVLFPQETPFRRTGEGAVVFMGRPGCRLGEGATLAAIGPDDRPRTPHAPMTSEGRPIATSAPLAATATTKGQVVLAGAAPFAVHPATLRVTEGTASGPFTAPVGWPRAQGPIAAASAYLGDVALAACPATSEGGVPFRLQRHFQDALHEPVASSGGRPSSRPCRFLSLALDYRSDAMAVWWHDGWLYAQERHEDGRLGPLQRFARASAKVQLATLISDDDRAIVAWVDPSEHSASLHLDVSRPGMLLGRGEVIERLRWGRGRPPAEGWVRLVRLSTEGVLMAWTGTESRHLAVRRADVTLRGLRGIETLSGRGEAAVLEDLATGPRGDALALWTASRSDLAFAHTPSRTDRPRAGRATRLMACWMIPHSRRVAVRPRAQAIARNASTAGGAIDPGTGTAVIAWRGPNGAIRYALGRASRS